MAGRVSETWPVATSKVLEYSMNVRFYETLAINTHYSAFDFPVAYSVAPPELVTRHLQERFDGRTENFSAV